MSLSKTQKTSPMLGESEKIYRTLIENANLGVAVIQDGKKVYSNSWLATLAGYTVEEFQHIELVEAIHPDDREFTFDRIRQRLEQNTMDPDLAELRILTKSGEAKWIETNSTFILWDDRPAIQAFIIDITDRKSAENALQEAHDELEKRIDERTSELRQKEKILAEAQHIARLGNWWWDIIQDKTHWSEEMFTLFEVDPEELRPSKQAFLDFVHPDDLPLVIEKITTILTRGESFSLDHRILLPDGSIKSVNSKARLEYGQEDKPVRLFGVVQDITRRKKTEEDLRIKESAIASSISGIGMTDSQGTLVYVNDSLVKMWGFESADEILGRHLFDFWEGDEVKKTAEILRTEGSRIGEDVGKRKDGSLFPIQYSATLQRDEAGNPLYMFGSFIDISYKKDADEKLKESERSLAEAQRIARLGSWDWDIPAGRTLWSDEVFHIFGMKPKKTSVSSREFTARVHPDDRTAVEETTRRALEKPEKGFDHQYRIVRPDGSIRFVHEYGQVRVDKNGKAVFVRGTTQDITEIKALEAETQKLRTELAHLDRVVTLSALTGAMAHEVNQPLTAILNNAQAALRYLNPDQMDLDEVREALKDIISDDKRARDVVTRLRALLKKKEGLKEPFDLNSTIRETVRLLHSEILLRKASIKEDLSEELPEIRGDRIQIQQVVINLLMNALDAVHDHQPESRHIEISTHQGEGAGIKVTVNDSGPGISPEVLESMFEPFFTTKAQGTGLGLTVCRSIAASYGGRLQAENRADGGASVSLWIPSGESVSP